MIVAEYIAKFLQKIGVTDVFGYDGSMMLKIADEISLTDGINYYQGFHEQESAFAADAYARVTGNIGTILVTSGPGAVNALCGCADAYMDSIPLLIITGNDRLSHIESNPGVRLNGFQDLDIVSMAKPITKYAVQLKKADDTAYEFEKAVYIAMHGRKGPVLVDVPMDVQFWEVPANIRHYTHIMPGIKRAVNEQINQACNMIYSSERPVILTGGAVRTAGAYNELERFVDLTGIPVVTTLNGHDSCPESIGSNGFYGLPEANLAVYYADLVIVLGARLGERNIGKFADRCISGQLIHVDIDEKEIDRTIKPDLGINSDIKYFLNNLNKFIDSGKINELDQWKKKISEWKLKYHEMVYVNPGDIDPVRLVEHVGEVCSEKTIFTNDTGQNTMWVMQGLVSKKGQRLLTSSGYASMGFSVPAAIGAKMASPDYNVVSFSGDGGFHMNLQALQFVKLHHLDIKFIIFNNNTLGMMRDVQRIYYNNNFVGSNEKEFTCLDLERVAELYDIGYLKIQSGKDYKYMDEVLNGDKSLIIDCRLPIDTYVKNWRDVIDSQPEILMEDINS